MRLGSIWAAPLSVFALLLWPLWRGAQVRRRQGAWLIYGAGCARFLKPLNFGAMAVGEVVFAPDRATLGALLAHEWTHVRQARRYGPLFPFLYCGDGLLCALRGGHAYRDNRFEREAREFAALHAKSDA